MRSNKGSKKQEGRQETGKVGGAKGAAALGKKKVWDVE